MHAVLVTFQSALSLEHAEPAFFDYAQALDATTGLVLVTWMYAGTRIGSYHAFTDRAAAEQYLADRLFKQVKTNPAFTDFEIRHFEVIDSLSLFAGTTLPPPRT